MATMSGRICFLLQAPSLAEAQTQAMTVDTSDELFSASVTSTTTAVAGTVLDNHYLVVMGPHTTIQGVVESNIPDDWDELEQTWHNGDDDASATTWLPDDRIICYLLGVSESGG